KDRACHSGASSRIPAFVFCPNAHHSVPHSSRSYRDEWDRATKDHPLLLYRWITTPSLQSPPPPAAAGLASCVSVARTPAPSLRPCCASDMISKPAALALAKFSISHPPCSIPNPRVPHSYREAGRVGKNTLLPCSTRSSPPSLPRRT